jgi:hypothetical protein
MSISFLEAYQYTETGFNAAVGCIYNTSTDYRLSLIQNSNGDGAIPDIYLAHGNLPNGIQGGGYIVPGLSGDDNIVAIGFV